MDQVKEGVKWTSLTPRVGMAFSFFKKHLETSYVTNHRKRPDTALVRRHADITMR